MPDKKRVILLCLILLSLLSHQAYAAETTKVFNAKTFELDNGLRGIVVENPRVPVVTHMVWYRAGAADEKWGQSGNAHFLEHLMFKGTGSLGPGEFSRRVKIMGGRDNAFTSQDYTAYFQTVGRQSLAEVMAMEADRMRGLNPPAKHVASEKQVVIEERLQVVENDPRRLLQEQIDASIYVNHPYANPVIGWRQEIEQLDWNSAKSFYDQWYYPNNATLILSGDITLDDARSLAQKYYGPIPAGYVAQRNWPDIPDTLQGRNRITLYNKNVQQRQFHRVIRIPSQKNHPELSPVFDVLSALLSGKASTLLHERLVKEKKLVSDISFSAYPTQCGDGEARFFALPLENVADETVEKALDAEIYELLENGFSEQDIRDAKERMKIRAVYARDSVSGPAMIIGRHVMSCGDLENLEYWTQNIDQVSGAQLQEVLMAYLDPKRTTGRVDAWLYPEDEEGAQ